MLQYPPMKIDVITLFPEMFNGPMNSSILKRAHEAGLFELHTHYLRDWAVNDYGTVDMPPFGGGAGMVLMVEPFFKAVNDIDPDHQAHRIMMTPQGQPLTQRKAEDLSQKSHLLFMCGHYEGYDERIRQHLVDEEISIGDYVLTGGELPAMVTIEASVRLLPGVVGKSESVADESFSHDLLEYPHYTRPEEFNDWKVPDILLSGNHAEIDKWRRQQALKRTQDRRPDLLNKP